jgi:hypothetical protein
MLDTLERGTVVAVDTFGIPRYKASCSNRLVEVGKSSISVAKDSVGGSGAMKPTKKSPIEKEDSLLGSFAKGLFDAVLSLIGILLALALLALVVWGLYEGAKRLPVSSFSESHHAGAIATPPSTSAQPAPTPVPTPVAESRESQVPATSAPSAVNITEPAKEPTFVSFHSQGENDGQKLKFSGMRNVSMTKNPGGETVITFTPKG